MAGIVTENIVEHFWGRGGKAKEGTVAGNSGRGCGQELAGGGRKAAWEKRKAVEIPDSGSIGE
jgi:hypothetical protein